jgi:hypothetical protein
MNDFAAIQPELQYPIDFGGFKIGTKGLWAKRIQEWLVFHGYNLVIDADFGSITDKVVKDYQAKEGYMANGVVDTSTFNRLSLPMKRALDIDKIKSYLVGGNINRIVVTAKQHLDQHPRELGDANSGAWVRLYMKGNEGINYPWCAGFVSFILSQVKFFMPDIIIPRYSFSCTDLVNSAKSVGLPVGNSVKDLYPGCLFVIRNGNYYTHIGIIKRLFDGGFESIEGNSNCSGSAEGIAVVSNNRSFNNKDFIYL